jgi:hypothetical protein
MTKAELIRKVSEKQKMEISGTVDPEVSPKNRCIEPWDWGDQTLPRVNSNSHLKKPKQSRRSPLRTKGVSVFSLPSPHGFIFHWTRASALIAAPILNNHRINNISAEDAPEPPNVGGAGVIPFIRHQPATTLAVEGNRKLNVFTIPARRIPVFLTYRIFRWH